MFRCKHCLVPVIREHEGWAHDLDNYVEHWRTFEFRGFRICHRWDDLNIEGVYVDEEENKAM